MADVESRLLDLVSKIAKKNGYNDKDIVLKPISSGGANYTSQLFSIILSSAGKKDLKLFSKVATLSEKVRSMSDTQVYEIEIIFYSEIVPKLRELEERNSIENRLVLPKYYGGVIDYAEELMVLEDYTAKGFKAFNRFKCFDRNYALTCVGELAKLHALTVAFERDDPKKYSEIVSKLKFNAPEESLANFIKKNIATAVEVTDEVNRARVEEFLRDQVEKQSFIKFFYPERKVLLTHGDFRPSNILQKIDEDGKLQVVIVDYQMIRRGNPVTDLLYFLICGSDAEFRSQYMHKCFEHYYETWSTCLRHLGIASDTVLTKEDYLDDIKELLPFGLILATMVLLFVTVEEEKAPKPETGLDFDNINIKASDQFQVRFNALVRDYIKWGYL